MRLAVLGGLALLVPACSLVVGYPSNQTENTALLCHNHLDDDYDGTADCRDLNCGPYCGEGTRLLCRNGIDDDDSGLTDCADPSCTGLCREETPAECSDRVDQDGDGLVDTDDPSCWPSATTTITRCVEERGGSWTASVGTPGDGWLAFGGDAQYVPDSTLRYTHDVIQLPLPAAVGMTSGVRNATTVTGSISELVARASVYLPGGPTQILVELVAPTSAQPGTPSLIALQLDENSLSCFYRVDGALRNGGLDGRRSFGWYDVSIEMHEAAITLSAVAADGSSSMHFDLPLTVTLGSEAPLGISVSQTGGNGGLLGEASLTRANVRPCGNEIVVPPTDPARGAPVVLLLSAASDGHHLCVLGQVEQNDPTSFRSDDGGHTFGPGATIPVGATSGGAYCAAVAWDAERRVFAGLAWVRSTTELTATLLSSPDCVTWTTQDAPAFATDAIRCSTYSIVRAPGVVTHELWRQSPAPAGTLAIARHWSLAPFEPNVAPTADPFVRVTALPGVSYRFQQGPPVYAFAGDLLAMVTLDSVPHVLVVDRGLNVARDWAAFAPSHIDGTCDATSVPTPMLYFDAPTRGGIAHTCDVAALIGGPTVVRTYAITAPPAP